MNLVAKFILIFIKNSCLGWYYKDGVGLVGELDFYLIKLLELVKQSSERRYEV